MTNATAQFAILFGIGRIPFAPGTVASFAALILAVPVHYFLGANALFALAIVTALFGAWVADTYEQETGRHDPKESRKTQSDDLSRCILRGIRKRKPTGLNRQGPFLPAAVPLTSLISTTPGPCSLCFLSGVVLVHSDIRANLFTIPCRIRSLRCLLTHSRLRSYGTMYKTGRPISVRWARLEILLKG